MRSTWRGQIRRRCLRNLHPFQFFAVTACEIPVVAELCLAVVALRPPPGRFKDAETRAYYEQEEFGGAGLSASLTVRLLLSPNSEAVEASRWQAAKKFCRLVSTSGIPSNPSVPSPVHDLQLPH